MPTEKSRFDQLERFKETAREYGADESDSALDRIFGKLDVRKKPERHDEGKQRDGDTDNDNADG